MKKKKVTLNIDQEIDFELIGICSHLVDYRLVWDLNKVLGFHFERIEDYCVYNKTGTKMTEHSTYEYIDDENKTMFFLVKNKHEGQYLVPEKSSIDYFLFLYENYIENVEELTKRIKKATSVLGVYPFEPTSIASVKNIELI